MWSILYHLRHFWWFKSAHLWTFARKNPKGWSRLNHLFEERWLKPDHLWAFARKSRKGRSKRSIFLRKGGSKPLIYERLLEKPKSVAKSSHRFKVVQSRSFMSACSKRHERVVEIERSFSRHEGQKRPSAMDLKGKDPTYLVIFRELSPLRLWCPLRLDQVHKETAKERFEICRL